MLLKLVIVSFSFVIFGSSVLVRSNYLSINSKLKYPLPPDNPGSVGTFKDYFFRIPFPWSNSLTLSIDDSQCLWDAQGGVGMLKL